MGNGVGKLTVCFTGADVIPRRKDTAVVISDPLDDLGHSFCYVRPDPTRISSSKVHCSRKRRRSDRSPGPRSSANTSTPLSTSLIDLYSYSSIDKASAFESSTSFASIPLQPLPRSSINSGPLYSGPVPYSGPIERGSRKRSLIRVIKRAISRTFIGQTQNSIVAPINKNVGSSLKVPDWIVGSSEKNNELTISSVNLSSEGSFIDDDDCLNQSQNLQWAQGKAGEDRVHVVVSEEHGWVFVELKGLLWDDEHELDSANSKQESEVIESNDPSRVCVDRADDFETNFGKNRSKNSRVRGSKKWEDNHRRWKCEFDRERLELDRRLKQELNSNGSNSINHSDVLKALSQGLKKTEEAYLDIADQMLVENPELALMGSCVLVMLMKEEDVYVMNVGDSRAVLAQKPEPDLWRQDLERINEETLYDLEVSNADNTSAIPTLTACQLTMDHSTSINEEVERIKNEHRDDSCAVMNDRVKGSLKVTRAFGAGFLKQPKWNDALLEMFRIDYVGSSPYINCVPNLYHHRLGPRDRFLILSSDGLYQYFTNEEAVSEVELFIQWSPEGDPAQHLIEEVLFRAAKKAGMDFHELLEIPQGDRRRYHDDVSIIVISLEGRIWRSCV
ncbi:hypothetical protein OSB04_001297 [Centaurea solstitialis]|uniref:PPM-type phosphatase domain-containing protein n=1 Tax=Centaurea solstitialis TaxID=347529 RepID=A0AA38U1A7_9ASTR|nr:hypothetical protein OSB04_001297 [Centaurea solstitialis]